jgi:hypothetical protein
LKYITQLSDLEKQLRDSNESKHRLSSLHLVELEELNTKYGIQIKDLQDQVVHLSESNTRSGREIQQLLSEQRILADRWLFQIL